MSPAAGHRLPLPECRMKRPKFDISCGWQSERQRGLASLADRDALNALSDEAAWRLDHLIDDPVALSLGRRHVLVAVEITLDPFERLTRVAGQELEGRAAQVKDFPGLDLDVGGRAATAVLGRLVHHDPRVRQ